MSVLKVENISKKYGNFVAVKNLSFSISEGMIYGLLGPNGAGKTTTIRMIMNIIMPDQGTIEILNHKMDEQTKEKVGYLPEERGLYPKMKVEELLVFIAEIKGLKRGEAKEKIYMWLDRFSLSDWKTKKVEELSKGMQQKLQFIATIIHQPELIILDEPFAGLDPVNTKLLKDIMLEMKHEGRSIIFSTHRMEQVEMICDNICLINKAESVIEGELDFIKKQYGKNSIILDYDGNGSYIRSLPEIETIDDYGKSMEIKLKEKKGPQDLLKKIAGRIDINKFEIKEPTLNAIFIEKVEEKDEKNMDSY